MVFNKTYIQIWKSTCCIACPFSSISTMFLPAEFDLINIFATDVDLMGIVAVDFDLMDIIEADID